MESDDIKSLKSTYLAPLFAGAIAGVSVDVALYPLDTLKTRLQSEQGFIKAGGFTGIYRGLLTVATASMPTTAIFFVAYESTKNVVLPHVELKYAPVVHMLGASIGEVLACVIRVPTEVAKQRKQTYVGGQKKRSVSILLDAYKSEGLRKGVYRGFLSTVARDLPFSFIEFPLWELLKHHLNNSMEGKMTSLQSALCGSVAGGVAAALTTPLDLAKTRIMLAPDASATRKIRLYPVLEDIYVNGGFRALFTGLAPRMTAFSVGGLVFFGAYDYAKSIFEFYF